MGENLGVEINGKKEYFTRPALVLKKLSKHCLWVIPLTSQEKTGDWYVKFNFHNRVQYAVVSQIKMISASRLKDYMGRVDDTDFARIKRGFEALYKK